MTDKEVLQSLIEEVVRGKVEGKQVGILFSGGLDSTIIASIAKRYSAPMSYTVGIEGSHDLLVGRSTAAILGLDWTPVILKEEQLVSLIRGMLEMVEISDPVAVSYQLPMYLVARSAEESILLSGQGADELFGGYARYENMEAGMLERRMEEDLDRVINLGSEWDKRIAAHFGKSIVHPYLDSKVIGFVNGLSFERRIYGGIRKALLRDVARAMGLGEVADRPKKAAQYGSGIMKAMKSVAKRRGLSLGDLVLISSEEAKES